MPYCKRQVLSMESLNLKIFILVGLLAGLTHGFQVISSTYKKVDVPGTALTSWAFSSSIILSESSCVSNCLANSPSCNFAYYESVSKTCYLGTAKANNAFYKSVPPSIVKGYLDFGQLKNWFTNQFYQITALQSSNWNNFIYSTSTSTQLDPFWDCLNTCYNVNLNCAYFAWINSTCLIGNPTIVGRSVPFSAVTIYTVKSFVDPSFNPTSPLAGSNWSSKIFKAVTSVSTASQCASYCYLPNTPRCHYYVFISGTCYLGNAQVTSSAIAARTDAQVVYASAGSFYIVNAIDFTNFFRVAAGSNVGDCLIICLTSTDCQYTAYLSGTGCLIGNFGKSQTSFPQPSSISTYIIIDTIAIQNYPDSKYFNTSVANSVWTPKITSQTTGITSEGLCSAICTLTYPNCQLYVYIYPTCFLGTLATTTGTFAVAAGTYTMMTKILYNYGITSGSGIYTFGVNCPTGFNLLSCGTNNYQYSNYEVFRGWWPSGSTCIAYDYWGVYLTAWCTTMPVKTYSVASVSGYGVIQTTCPVGTYAIGCHIEPYRTLAEGWKRAIPLSDQRSCECYDFFGSTCYATCASNVLNYELVTTTSNGDFYATCTKPNNTVLGCGFRPNQADYYASAAALSNTGCKCHNGNNGICFAICGSLQN